MNQRPDEGREDLMEKSIYDSIYTRNGKNIPHRKLSPASQRQRKLLLFGGTGILLLVGLISISFRACNRYSADALNSIQDRVNQLEGGLTRLEGIENRIVLLEKQERRLQQSISKLYGSERSLREQLDKMTQKIELLKKGMASVAVTAKTERPHADQEKPISEAEMRYHEVRYGDTLYSIAKKYGISVDELRRLNNLTRNQFIYPGQKLLVAPSGRQ